MSDVVLHVWRYGRLEDFAVDSVEEARSLARGSMELGEGWPDRITVDGEVAHRFDATPPWLKPAGRRPSPEQEET